MLKAYIEKAKQGQCVWLPDVRDALSGSSAAVPVIFSLTLCTGERIDRCHPVPKWRTQEERDFAAEYLNACVFNTLALYSGRELCFYPAEKDGGVLQILRDLPTEFSSGGRSKCIKVARRISRGFGGDGFQFKIADISDYVPQAKIEEPVTALTDKLRAAAEREKDCCSIGVDIGGTDIKLAAAKGDTLVCTKEFDWNPAESGTAEEIIEPILVLVRLMRACLAAYGTEAFDKLKPALCKDASVDEMRRAAEEAEESLGEKINVLDAVGISFPDICIRDRIIGGETPKTRGMRNNPAIDYEADFARLTSLNERIAALCRNGARIRIINDGSMAAFTAAMELAHGDGAALIGNGVIAHSLGTDLGSGWMTGEGVIPPIPLEMYDALLDLGSRAQREFPVRDLRSVRNENSGLPGVRRYMGQTAAFRLAYELKPALLQGFAEAEDGMIIVREKDPDKRKPCLEHLMTLAEQGDGEAQEIFRIIGRTLGKVCREMEFLLETGIDTRFLFGRFVKRARCFELLCEGCAETAPEIKLIAADSELALTPLMRALDKSGTATVAQFGQAVGSLYFAFV